MDLKSFFHREIRQQDITGQTQQFHFIHHFVGVVNGFRQVVEYLAHFRRFLEVKLVVWKGKPPVLHVHIIIGKITQGRGGLFFPGIDTK